MQAYLQTHHIQNIQPSFLGFQRIQRKYAQSDLIKTQATEFSRPYISEQDYWDRYYEMKDVCYEWCNGQLEEKPMADLASFIMYSWFLLLLKEYFRNFPEGTIVGLEICFKMSLPNTTSIRKPDLALILKSNPVQMLLDERSYKGCFDICIEFLSDSNKMEIERDTIIKKAEYEQSAIKEYFILDRKHVHTIFYRLNQFGKYEEIMPDNDGVIRSTVLPYFQFRYMDLFRLPSNEHLRKDPVYKHYFQTDFIQEQQRANNAIQKAEDAIKKAEDAEKKAADEKRRADYFQRDYMQEQQRADKAIKRAADEKRRADEAIEREKKLLQELAILKKF